MAKRPRHKDKDIEAAIRYAEENGWEYVRPGHHPWGVLHCPLHTPDGCHINVQSTPAVPRHHANDIRRRVKRCTHRATTE